MLLHPIAGTNRAILADDRIMGWVGSRIPMIGPDYKWHDATAIGLVQDGHILAGMIVHNYDPMTRNCHLTFAADTPRWATKSSIRAMLAYPFEQLRCRRVTTDIAAKNTRAIKLNLGLGFVQEGILRHGFGDDDRVILGLLIEECPDWMGFNVAPTPQLAYGATHSKAA